MVILSTEKRMHCRFICIIILVAETLLSWEFAVPPPPSPLATFGAQNKQQDKGRLDAGHHHRNREKEPEESECKRLMIGPGSKPPKCEHKCGGCLPCVPVQVPETTSVHLVMVEYANYEPEGWVCKCGSSFFIP